MHKSVGAIIKKDGKILMLDRKKFPFGWAGPSGHIEEGETPDLALLREIKEEVNLEANDYKLLFHEFVDWNECSKGVKGHDWYVYEVTGWNGEVNNNEEAKDLQWIEPQKLKKIILEKVWAHWFKKLKLM